LNKPKLILHIGHAKTGTTSIQDFLAKNNKNLLELGYLYPVRLSPRNNHVVLRAGFLETEHLNTHDFQVYEGNDEWFKKDAELFLKAMSEDIERFKPHTVILSAEQMFRDFSSRSKISLAEFLGGYFSKVLVVAYIKNPIENYISSLSQLLRTGINNLAPKLRPIKNVIEYYEGQFPGSVKLHSFERSQLINGDVLNDFLARYAPDAVNLLKYKKVNRSNISLSWPLLLTLRKLRLQVQPEGKKPLMQTRMLLARIAKENQKKIRQQTDFKPQLRAQVSDYLHQSAGDFFWLRECYGVNFPGLNYDLIKPAPNAGRENLKFDSLNSIIDTSNIVPIVADIRWYKKKGGLYHLSYFSFIWRMRLKRVVNLYFRSLLSLRYTFKP